jgi:hypothetical protein
MIDELSFAWCSGSLGQPVDVVIILISDDLPTLLSINAYSGRSVTGQVWYDGLLITYFAERISILQGMIPFGTV